jgi:hypothetical protein
MGRIVRNRVAAGLGLVRRVVEFRRARDRRANQVEYAGDDQRYGRCEPGLTDPGYRVPFDFICMHPCASVVTNFYFPQAVPTLIDIVAREWNHRCTQIRHVCAALRYLARNWLDPLGRVETIRFAV